MTDEINNNAEGDSNGGLATEDRGGLKAAALKPKHPMEFFLKAGGNSLFPKVGELVDGTVLEKKGTRMFVDLGPRGIGIVFGREYYNAQDAVKSLNPGDPISAKVVETDNDEGYIELSLKEAGEERRWVELLRMRDEGEVLELPVLEANRGGLLLESKGIKGFLPASQLSSQHYPRVEGGDKERIYQELQKLVGEKFKVKVLDLDPKENKLIFTERGQSSDETKAALSQYKVGDEVEGEITGVVDFGAFMKFGEPELNGLIHISEIDWTLIEDPRNILKIGEKVKAKIIDINGEKVSLSLKQLKEDPWLHADDRYKKGDVVKGRVMKFNSFGAFVQLDKDIHGLAHISEFGTEENMRAMLELDKEYKFTILLIDPKEHRLSLQPANTVKKEVEAPAVEPKKE